jgi:tRNA A-37 threonylcarbamoyl transferase component Bud32
MTRDSLIDTLAGNYRLVERLGSGGMGEVYKGVHTTIGSRVAIKVLHATAAREADGEPRFLREAQAVNRIEHDGVVKVIDAGRLDGGRPYLVMELLDGMSLAERQHRARAAKPDQSDRIQLRLPIRDACQIAIDVLDAVAAAHAAGVIHRDIKPPNIFQTRAGRTVVLDFGVAKLLAADAPVRLTLTGAAVGTPHYMAPEQIQDRDIGPHTDIYAIGVVLFELLCGRLPFEGADPLDVMKGHLERRPPPPRALRPEIPHAIQNVVLTAMAKEPAKRFASAAAMRDALRAALDAPPVAADASAPPPPVIDASPASPRRRKVPVMPFVAVGIAAAGIAIAVWWVVRDPDDETTTAARPARDAAIDAAGATIVATCDTIGAALDLGAPDQPMREAFDAMIDALARVCREDRWPVDVIECYSVARDPVAMGMCPIGLPFAQQERLGRVVADHMQARIDDAMKPDAATTTTTEPDETPPDHHERGKRYLALGMYDQAILSFHRAILKSSEPEVLFDLAEAHRLKGDCRRATTYYNRFLAKLPTSRRARAARDHVAACEPTTPTTPTTPTPATTGILSIESDPQGARAEIRGVLDETTPWSGTLTTGRYTVSISKTGYETVVRDVDVDGTKLVVLKVVLQTSRDPF